MDTKTAISRRVVPAILCGAAVLVGLAGARPEIERATGWRLLVHPGKWVFGTHREQTIDGVVQEVKTTAYRLGPITLSQSRFLTVPGGIRAAANELKAGMVLYSADAKRELGRVLLLEEEHHFPDKSSGAAVLLRAPDGTASWVRRESLSNSVVGW